MSVDIPRDRLSAVQNLLSLSSTDLLYADCYLARAEALLSTVYTRDAYACVSRDQQQLPEIKADLRQATERKEWARVETLAREAAAADSRLVANASILPLSAAVYGPRLLRPDAAAFALGGVVATGDVTLRHARDEVLEELRWLKENDGDWRPFYDGRIEHFERLEILSGEELHPTLDPDQLQRKILAAVADGDFSQVQRLARAIPTESSTGPASRVRASPPLRRRTEHLALPLPPKALERARDLGLTATTMSPAESLNKLVALGSPAPTTFRDAPMAATRDAETSEALAAPCAPGVSARLAENLDLLMGHTFINAGGVRYAPWFGQENLLVEVFPETESDARTGLSSALGLSRRRGLSRAWIEDALLTHGFRVCENLRLDPAEFMVACIPFDVYLRLAPEQGWGKRDMWTHLDGYQVTGKLTLLGLVGGRARYGGPEDLASIARDYESEALTVRFVVLRRDRFLVRESEA